MLGTEAKARLVEQQQAGSDISARPIASICCSPPISVPASCCAALAGAGKRSKPMLVRRSNFLACRGTDRRRARGSPRPSCSARRGALPGSARCRRDDPVGRQAGDGGPRRGCCRARALSSPEIARSVVLLPAPLAPISATVSPAPTSRLIAVQRGGLAVGDVQRRRSTSGASHVRLVSHHACGLAQIGFDHARVRPGSPPACPRRASGRSSSPPRGPTRPSPAPCCARPAGSTRPSAGQRLQHLAEARRLVAVQPRRRLVEHQDRRPGRQRHAPLRAAAVRRRTAGRPARSCARPSPMRVDDLGRAVAHRASVLSRTRAAGKEGPPAATAGLPGTGR